MTDMPAGLRRYRELDGKTLLLCIGAAKCATSWLHGYLEALPEVAVSPLKEVHFFNARFAQHALGDMQALAMARLGFHLAQPGDAAENLAQRAVFQASLDRAQMIYDDNAYFGHFARLSEARTRVFCDITPAYSVIGRDGFAYLRAFCASQEITLKVLYVMRDPVDRLWSQLRHLQQMKPENDAITRWPDALASEAVMARADYAATLAALDAVFAPDQVLHLFYETLFEETSLRTLCRFLGVAYQPGDPSRRMNETQIRLSLPADARAAFADRLAPQYAACRARFGALLPEGWRDA